MSRDICSASSGPAITARNVEESELSSIGELTADNLDLPENSGRYAVRLECREGNEARPSEHARAAGRFPLTGREHGSERQRKRVCGCTGECTCDAGQLNMHDAEGIKSTPRTADGLCRRATINVHRPNTPPGAPGENKPEKVDLYKRATPQQACGQREILARKIYAPCRAAAASAPSQGRGAAAALAGAPAGAAAAAATDGARCRRLHRAAGSGR